MIYNVSCVKYIGPYEILERIGPVAYRLALPPNLAGVHDVFHVLLLRKCLTDVDTVIDSYQPRDTTKSHLCGEASEDPR